MDFITLIISMAAGVFGTAIGALASFIFVGVLILVGVAIQAGGGGDAFLGTVAFGIYGPHVAGFASGVAAAAWAGSRGKLDIGRDIASSGMGWDSPTGLLIGAVFGGIGYLINWGLSLVGVPWTDTVALTVVVSAIIARLVFGKTGVFGKRPAGQKTLARPPAGSEWIPYQCDPAQLLLIGLGAGGMSAYIANAIGAENGGVFIGFAVSAVSLLFLQVGFKVPVTHHITLVAAVAAAASGSLIWGALFGLMAAFVGEFYSRLFLVYGDTHIDPPACAIATLTSASILSQNLGIYSSLGETAALILVVLILGAAAALSIQGKRSVVPAGASD